MHIANDLFSFISFSYEKREVKAPSNSRIQNVIISFILMNKLQHLTSCLSLWVRYSKYWTFKRAEKAKGWET